MAWYDFLNPFHAAGEAINGVVGTVTGIYDNAASLWGGSSQQKFERHQSEDARNFTHQENELQRQFARQMWEDTNAYNTPTAQKQRLEQAGMNPYVNMENAGTAQSVTPAPGGSASATTGTQGAAQIAQGNAIASSQAAKNMAEAERSREMLPYDKNLSTSNKVLADFQGAKAYQEAVGQELQNAIVSAFGMKEKELQIRDWQVGLRYKLALAINEEQRRNVITQQIELLKKQINLTDEQAKQLHEYVTKYMANDYYTQFGLRASEIHANEASAVNSYASANEHNATAESIRTLTPYQAQQIAADTELKKAMKKVTNLDFSIRSKTRSAEVMANLNEFNTRIKKNKYVPALVKSQVDYFVAQAYFSQQRGDYEGVRAWTDAINRTADTVINGVNAYQGAKGGKGKAPTPPMKMTPQNTNTTGGSFPYYNTSNGYNGPTLWR